MFQQSKTGKLIKLCVLSSLALGPLFASAHAEDAFPNRPIKIIVPFPPGGGTDMFGRVVAQELSEQIGWNVVIENRPGAGGNIGVQAAVHAKPDGYTLVLGQTSNLAVNPTLYGNLPYAPEKDLDPIVLVADSPVLFAVGATSKYQSLADIISTAHKKPGEISMAYSGNGTVSHLTAAYLANKAGVKFMQVPYKGAANAMTDLMANRIDVYASSVPTLLGYIRDKKLRPVGVTSEERIKVLPDTTTLGETPELKDFVAITWFGLLAPAGTPAAVVQKINESVNTVLRSKTLTEKFESEGSRVLGGTPAQFKEKLSKDTALWADVINKANIKIN
ncbi:Bug family tripartite tricarboxylate transporter substrate binding protein [Advenella kashmirensis]|nr:tripartite tricarboxylate transporter substrate binding protein [Advenella kashmirensis]